MSRRETRGSSVTCPRCGERLQSDKRLKRKLWCGKCRIVMDRDMVAAINLARRGRVRFARSRPPHHRGARQGRSSNEGEPDAYGNPWSRCPEANSTNEELAEPISRDSFRVLTKVARCTMVSANEGTHTLASAVGIIVNPASKSCVGSDQLHFEQLRCHCKQICYD